MNFELRADRRHDGGDIVSNGLSQKKALELLVMFAALTALYYACLVPSRSNSCTVISLTLPFIASRLLKIFALTGWPFALMAAADPDWRSRDAGNVLAAAFMVTEVLLLHKTGCPLCVLFSALLFIPYAFCAWLAHGLGALRHARNAGD